VDSFYIEPEIYRKYRDQVIALSQSIQVNYPENLPPEKRKPGLSSASTTALTSGSRLSSSRNAPAAATPKAAWVSPPGNCSASVTAKRR
jgi:hypothetical protein